MRLLILPIITDYVNYKSRVIYCAWLVYCSGPDLAGGEPGAQPGAREKIEEEMLIKREKLKK